MRGDRREPEEVAADARAESDLAVARLLLGRVSAFHTLTGTSSDVLDAKATGLLTADIAAGTILIAAHGNVGRLWVLPACGMLVAAALFFHVIKTRVWDFGPDIDEFRQATDGVPPVEAVSRMAAEMRRSWELNCETVDSKGSWIDRGYGVLLVSLVVAVLLATIHSFTE